jgi:hypothetical protein
VPDAVVLARFVHRPNNVASNATEVGVSIPAELPGAAGLELLDGVVHLDPAPAVFEAMLTGWTRQQRTRFLKDRGTIEPRIALVRRRADFSSQYPWEWGPAEAEAFVVHLRSPRGKRGPIVVSTARGYENTLRMFMEYVTDRRYGGATQEDIRQSFASTHRKSSSLTRRSFHGGVSSARPYATTRETRFALFGIWRPGLRWAAPECSARGERQGSWLGCAAGIGESVLVGVVDGVGPVADAGLGEDVVDVGFDR